MRRACGILPLLHFAALVPLSGCIHAPDIVLVDRSTALEQEAAGGFSELEKQLVAQGMAPRPVPLSQDELEAQGIKKPAILEEQDPSDAERVDALLKEKCIGEALDGTLVDLHEQCGLNDDPEGLVSLIDRTNRERQQIWRWLQAQRPKEKADDVRRAWRAAHLTQVVCGGNVQRDDGKWEPKGC